MSSVVRFRVPILILLLAVTAFLCAQLGKIRLTTDPMASLYPTGHPFLPALQATQKMAPEPRMLIAILEVKSGDIYNPDTLRKIDRLTKGLMEVEGVLPGQITSLTRGMDHYENTAEGLAMDSILGMRWPETEREFEELKRRVAVNPRGPGRFVSYDGTAAMISAALAEGNDGVLMESLPGGVEALRSREEDERHNLYFMGPQLIEAYMTDMGSRHIPVAAACTFLALVVALLAYFRTLRGVLLPVLAMVLSLLWTLGILGASGVAFNPMPLVFPLILGLFSLAYGTLVVKEVERAYPRTKDKVQAIRAAYGRAPVAGSIATVGLVLASLFTVPVPVFRELAWLGLFWVIGTGAVVGLFLPVLISLVRLPGGQRHGQPSRSAGSAGTRGGIGMGRPVLWGLLTAVLLVGGVSATRLEVGDNAPGPSYIRPGHPWNDCFRAMAEKFLGPYQLLVYVKANQEEGLLDPETLHQIGDFSRYLRKQAGARDSIAFDMMVKSARNMMMDGNPKWQTIPRSREQVKGMGELVVDQGGVESFIDQTFTEATISPFFPEAETGRIEEYSSKMQGYIDRHPSDRLVFHLGGGLLGMTKAVNDGTRHAYGGTLALAFVLVLAAGVLVTGSLRSSLMAVLLIAAAQGVVWAVMAVAGARINMPVALVSAPAIGFCPLFGHWLIREVQAPADGADARGSPEARLASRGAIEGVLFLGSLMLGALFPWFFIGLRFSSQMALALGVTVFLAAIGSVVFHPLLMKPCTAGPPAGASEEPPA
jgi:predicted RND superfamily exporter protein